ncbi:hypothetical protein BCR44DRAFT_1436204 [Catenaria anguillulae PL171]|uniref:Uncharacterized protein n=1 Tax=Catenaria anguillulae PL171 TaxID=765915 RepID=A0A1Y2HMS9_9FUNG|nr:hypothetical protein BCR44DRAFT_1436204 [Catenaria anguillulae PL171]
MPLQLQLHDRFRLGLGWGFGPQNRPFRLPCTLQSAACAVLSAWAFLSLVGPQAFLLHLPIWLRTVLSPILIGDPYSPTLLHPHPAPPIPSNAPTPLLATTSPWTPLLFFALLYTLLLTTAHRAHSLAHADAAHLFPLQHARITREEAHAHARENAVRMFRICSYLFFLATLCLVQQQWRAATRAADRETRKFAARYTDPWRYERPLVKTLDRDAKVVEEGIKKHVRRIHARHVQVDDDNTKRMVDSYVAAYLTRAFNENNSPIGSKPANASSSHSSSSRTANPMTHLTSSLLASVWRSHFLMQWDRVWLALWLGDVLMIGALARLLGWSPRMLARELWWTTKAIVRDWTRGVKAGARVMVRGGRQVGRWVASWRRGRQDVQESEEADA